MPLKPGNILGEEYLTKIHSKVRCCWWCGKRIVKGYYHTKGHRTCCMCYHRDDFENPNFAGKLLFGFMLLDDSDMQNELKDDEKDYLIREFTRYDSLYHVDIVSLLKTGTERG